jgi:hypothetical protein
MPQQKPAADQTLNGGMCSGIGHTGHEAENLNPWDVPGFREKYRKTFGAVLTTSHALRDALSPPLPQNREIHHPVIQHRRPWRAQVARLALNAGDNDSAVSRSSKFLAEIVGTETHGAA